MTGKQRALNTIWGKPTDRTSVLPSIDVCYASGLLGEGVGECFCDTTLHAKALEKALEVHPSIDGLYVNLCLSQKHVRKTAEHFYVDSGGITWRVPENDVGTAFHHHIQTLDDPRLWQENPLIHGVYETFMQISGHFKENYLIIPGITGPYSQVVFMMGLQNVLMLLYDEPEELKKVLQQRVNLTFDWVDQLVEAGAQCVWLGEGAASSSVISPGAYREFVYPYAKQVVDYLKRKSVPCIMHVCGDIRPSIDFIADTGCQVLDVDYWVPADYARSRMQKGQCLKGNINPVDLERMNTKEVRQLCKHLVTEKGLRPFILSTGCLVTRDTPSRNIDAMVQAAEV